MDFELDPLNVNVRILDIHVQDDLDVYAAPKLRISRIYMCAVSSFPLFGGEGRGILHL